MSRKVISVSGYLVLNDSIGDNQILRKKGKADEILVAKIVDSRGRRYTPEAAEEISRMALKLLDDPSSYSEYECKRMCDKYGIRISPNSRDKKLRTYKGMIKYKYEQHFRKWTIVNIVGANKRYPHIKFDTWGLFSKGLVTDADIGKYYRKNKFEMRGEGKEEKEEAAS